MLAPAMRILGVDPGTHRLGFGVLDVDGPTVRCMAFGCLEAKRRDPIEVRLHGLYRGLTDVVAEWRPDHLAVEEPFVAPERGAKSGVAVGQAQALAMLAAVEGGLSVHRYAPSTVKAAVSG